jgi:hypothetical protein
MIKRSMVDQFRDREGGTGKGRAEEMRREK